MVFAFLALAAEGERENKKQRSTFSKKARN